MAPHSYSLVRRHVVPGRRATFLTDPADGLFRGPYLRLRRPFRPAEDGWQRHLDWWSGPWPYAHQAESFARLTTKDGYAPLPALVTTGTGSGKTESFLMPVLDHCLRARGAGKPGIEAVLLYPMNALAGDQAGRLGDLLEDPRLLGAGVSAGLYIGEASASRNGSPYKRVMVDRAEIRRNPPDILITNYKMLDLLLQRPQDASLWRDADLTYIVIRARRTGRTGHCWSSRRSCGCAPCPGCCGTSRRSRCSPGPTPTRRQPRLPLLGGTPCGGDRRPGGAPSVRVGGPGGCPPCTAATAAAPAGRPFVPSGTACPGLLSASVPWCCPSWTWARVHGAAQAGRVGRRAGPARSGGAKMLPD
ncbi:DEAD/DEAH box helicase [Streptomyces sp. NBC_00057]|uniref:DEAD/DEAH box helicase n=1 Tax=Streptomyces sp. NBC_00057 TaxID=2975634 RepID=UPI0038635134